VADRYHIRLRCRKSRVRLPCLIRTFMLFCFVLALLLLWCKNHYLAEYVFTCTAKAFEIQSDKCAITRHMYKDNTCTLYVLLNISRLGFILSTVSGCVQMLCHTVHIVWLLYKPTTICVYLVRFLP